MLMTARSSCGRVSPAVIDSSRRGCFCKLEVIIHEAPFARQRNRMSVAGVGKSRPELRASWTGRITNAWHCCHQG